MNRKHFNPNYQHRPRFFRGRPVRFRPMRSVEINFNYDCLRRNYENNGPFNPSFNHWQEDWFWPLQDQPNNNTGAPPVGIVPSGNRFGNGQQPHLNQVGPFFPDVICGPNQQIRHSSSSTDRKIIRPSHVAVDLKLLDAEDKLEKDLDHLGPLSGTIDNLLKVNWELIFPMTEKMKLGLAEKYSVSKPKKNAVYLCDRYVEFAPKHMMDTVYSLLLTDDVSKIIDAASEAFFIENVFGNYGVLEVVKIIQDLMTWYSTAVGHLHVSTNCLLVIILLSHVIVTAEAIQSLQVFRPKMSRPYSKAFSSDSFAERFRKLVTSLQNKGNRRKCYWMRRIWDSCLLDECLSKIDENSFWSARGIYETLLPPQYELKRKVEVEIADDDDEDVAIIAQIDKSQKREEVATVVLLSSEDEEEETPEKVVVIEPSVEIIHSENGPEMNTVEIFNPENASKEHNSCVESAEFNLNDTIDVEDEQCNNSSLETVEIPPEENREAIQPDSPVVNQNQTSEVKVDYLAKFYQYRCQWWPDWFNMDQKCIRKLLRKYYEGKDLDLAIAADMTTFKNTVFDLFSEVEKDKYVSAAKEAFFIHYRFGSKGVNKVTEFLCEKMLMGFDFCESSEWKLSSRLIAFVVSHIIVAVESTGPIVPKETEISYFKAFLDKNAISVACDIMGATRDDNLREQIGFLTSTWINNCNAEDRPSLSADIILLYEKHCFKEAELIISVIKYIKGKYDQNTQLYDEEKSKSVNSKSRKRKIEDTQVDDCEDDCVILEIDNASITTGDAKIAKQNDLLPDKVINNETKCVREKKTARLSWASLTKEVKELETSVVPTANKMPRFSEKVPNTTNNVFGMESPDNFEMGVNKSNSPLNNISVPLKMKDQSVQGNNIPEIDEVEEGEILVENEENLQDSDKTEKEMEESPTTDVVRVINDANGVDLLDNLLMGNLKIVFTDSGVHFTAIQAP